MAKEKGNEPEKRAGMTDSEREEWMRRSHEFWWGKRRPKEEQNSEEKK
ncbi:hypothetical protein [Bacillus aerolatus]|nr:hypothetical protein [Bacillus aerolatus]